MAPTTRTGYTLIEVLAVVTIMGIAGVVVVPAMLTPSSVGIQAAARTVIADILYAQNEAIAQQVPHRIVFDTTADRYWLEDATGQRVNLQWRTGDGETLIDFASDSRFQGIELATVQGTAPDVSGLTDEGGQWAITFNELGGPDQGGRIAVRSESSTFIITVRPFTGQVSVAEYEQPE